MMGAANEARGCDTIWPRFDIKRLLTERIAWGKIN
jgi:hypothetical protein